MKKILLLFIAGIFLISCEQIKKEEKEIEKIEWGKIDTSSLPSRMTPELLWKLGRVSDIQLSPDKKTILYGISYYDLESNKSNRNLYTLPVEGGEATKVTDMEGSEFNGLWRPDGEKIGFLAVSDSGTVQLWEMNTDGSEQKIISDIEDGVNGFLYSPEGNKILFIKDVKLDKSPNDIHNDLPLANARIINDLMYRHWNQWHDYAYSHIFVASYDNGKIGELKDIMENEVFDTPMNPWGGMEQINWNSEGNKIAYCCKKLSGKEYSLSTNSEIYVYDLESGNTENISVEGFEGYDHDPVFSPDGKSIVWKSMEEPGFEADKERIILYDFATKEHKDLTKDFDQSSSSFQWSEDGKNIYFISGHHATYQIYNINIETQEIKQFTKGDFNYQSYALAGEEIVASKMSMSLPTEIFKIDMAGNETQLSFTNNKILDNITLAKVEKRWIKTTDGKDMLTWIIYPPNFDPNKKYPALLYCQGGPQSAVSQFFSYRWNFQMMASNDYIIVAPNRRGLPTFGQEWNDQISGDYGGQNMKDYFSAIDEMAKESFIDENRLGAIGASYGGYSVFWLAGNHDKRFKAFISHCGIYNFVSMYGSTDEYFFVNKDYEGPCWEKPTPKSYEFSPHLFIDKWDTPIMIITGENDLRIPYTQSLEAFNSAQLRGVPSRLLIYPEETHFVLKPQNAVLWQREFYKWLDKYLKN